MNDEEKKRILEAAERVDKKKCLEFMYSIAYDWGTLPVFEKLLTFLESLPEPTKETK